MHRLLALLILLAITMFSIAQQKITLPQFPGGKKELDEYIKQQIETSSPAQNKAVYVSVLFYVSADGSIRRPVIATSNADIAAYDSLAVDIVRQMPRWIPGTIDHAPQEMAACVYIDFGGGDNIPELLVSEGLGIEPFSDELTQSDDDIYYIRLSPDDYLENNYDGEKISISIASVSTKDDSEQGIDIAELKEHKIIIEEKPIEEKPFVTVEQMPSFPGGEAELHKFIRENLKYPVLAREEGIQGRVVIRFVVEKDGTLSDFSVLRGIDPQCDKEAIRLMKTSPEWIAGKQNGREVNVYYTLPITFKIENDNNE